MVEKRTQCTDIMVILPTTRYFPYYIYVSNNHMHAEMSLYVAMHSNLTDNHKDRTTYRYSVFFYTTVDTGKSEVVISAIQYCF